MAPQIKIKPTRTDNDIPMAYGRLTDYHPVSGAMIDELVKPFTTASTGQCYFGPAGIDDTGIPWVIMITHDAARPRRYRENGHMGFIAWRWNVSPSCPFSLTLAGQKDKRPQSRWLAASEASVVQAIFKHGQFNVCLVHPTGQRSGWFEANFESLDGRRSTTALDRLLTFPVPGIIGSQIGRRFQPFDMDIADDAEQIPLWTDLVGDAWSALSTSGPWTDDLDNTDHKVIAWAECYRHKRSRAAGFIQMIIERQTLDNVPSLLSAEGKWIANHGHAEKLNETLDAHLSLRRWLTALAGPVPDAKTAHEAALETLRTPKAIFAFVAAVLQSIAYAADPEFAHALRFSFASALLDPRITGAGRMRPWLKNIGQSEFALQTIILDTSCDPEDLRTLWRAGLEMTDLIDAGDWFTATDLPAPLDQVNDALKVVRLEGSTDEAFERVKQLLLEAQEARQWSIPWGARIQIEFGPFVALRVFEVSGEFSCHFLDQQDRYLKIAVGLGSGPPQISSVELIREQEASGESIWNEPAVLSLQLIAAAIIRDFLIVEDREGSFGARSMRKRIAGRNINTIIYLPRVRYSRPLAGLSDTEVREDTYKTRFAVSHHLRKAETASPTQRFLAQRFGIALPKGFTFVRPHEKGGLTPDERIRVYRSRSASRMLFEQVASAPVGTRPAWFEFEKACMRLLERHGMSVVHQAANKDGDGGVDLFAVDADGKSWVVQCKCWALHRPVGPDVVRELLGAIKLADQGSDKISRGMIITTSRLTSGAAADAATVGITILEGINFN